jgi:CheY-like chemotaxis protein
MAGCKVLLVDDADDLRSYFRAMLALTGCEVREAADGLEALKILETEAPDVIVLDLLLPNVSGFAVLDELNAHANLGDIPVIVITGLQEPLGHLPAAAVLRKPIQAELLIKTVQSVARLAT